ncbi:hypothetical protein HOF17_00955 [Candidatus Peribacteria bacterium]|jgi:hypothetical protein|nr:hypothetical protein [Candidatus Peribacteria bacterium]
MNRKIAKIVSYLSLIIFISACSSPTSWQIESSDGPEGSEKVEEAKKAERLVFENQERNGQCWKTKNCIDGLICKNATKDVPGVCSMECEEDADCGNNFLCRNNACQRDCAETGEKCSKTRVCCFFDTDEDRKTDVMCVDREGDVRCQVAEEGEAPAEFPEPEEEEVQ